MARLQVGPSKAAMNVTGNSTIPACGSCYGSAIDGVCCNTCEEVQSPTFLGQELWYILLRSRLYEIYL